MANPPEPPSITDWLTALAPYLTLLVSLPLSYWLGILRGNRDLAIEKERLAYESQLERAKALQAERKQKIERWRRAILAHTVNLVDADHSLSFRAEGFARTEEYLSLRSHLPTQLRELVDSSHEKFVRPKDAQELNAMLTGSFPLRPQPLVIRDDLVKCIDQLEREWELS
jgi:hypothetical protein